MPAPIYLASDFLAAFLKLMPRGAVWPRSSSSTQYQVLSGLMPTYERSAAAAAALLVDAFPSTTMQLLPEWQATLGLPDPCAGASPALAQEQAQIVARLTARGQNQSAAYYIKVAASLGYDITITQFAPFVVGRGRVGQPLCNVAWAYVWQVNSPVTTATFFRVGNSTVGQALTVQQTGVLQCELTRLSPAHTVVIFNSGASS